MAKFKKGDKIRMIEDKDFAVTVEKVMTNGYVVFDEHYKRCVLSFDKESEWELEAPSEPSTQTKEESVVDIIAEVKKLLKNQLDKELDAMKQGKEFLLHEYKTNKRWFRVEGGRVTVEDVIKACFEFGWASHRNYEYDQREAEKDRFIKSELECIRGYREKAIERLNELDKESGPSTHEMKVTTQTEWHDIDNFCREHLKLDDGEVAKITITKEI